MLFILDDFGYRGSYYWYENGSDKPRLLVEGLVSDVMRKGKYKSLITIGSSKGGTCAIYFGLKNAIKTIHHVDSYTNHGVNGQYFIKHMNKYFTSHQ